MFSDAKVVNCSMDNVVVVVVVTVRKKYKMGRSSYGKCVWAEGWGQSE